MDADGLGAELGKGDWAVTGDDGVGVVGVLVGQWRLVGVTVGGSVSG